MTKRHSSRQSSVGVENLDIQQAADYLNVSKSTIRRWCNMGILECVRINGRGDRRFKKESLDAAIAPRRPGRPKKKRDKGQTDIELTHVHSQAENWEEQQ